LAIPSSVNVEDEDGSFVGWFEAQAVEKSMTLAPQVNVGTESGGARQAPNVSDISGHFSAGSMGN
jgi:hypothetical protein